MASSSTLVSKEKKGGAEIRADFKLRPILSFEKQLSIMSKAYHFRVLLCNLPQEGKEMALRQWIAENRLSFCREIYALARHNVSREEQTKIADALLEQLQSALLLISDDFISKNLEESIRHSCANHQIREYILRLNSYEHEMVIACRKYFPGREDIIRHLKSYWEDKRDYAQQHISWKELVADYFRNLGHRDFFVRTSFLYFVIIFSQYFPIRNMSQLSFIWQDIQETFLMLIGTFATAYAVKHLFLSKNIKAAPAIQANDEMLDKILLEGLTEHFEKNPKTKSSYEFLLSVLPKRESTAVTSFPEDTIKSGSKIARGGTIGRNGATSSSAVIEEPDIEEEKIPDRPGEILIPGTRDFMKFDPHIISDDYAIQRDALTAAFAKGMGLDGGVKRLNDPYPYEIVTGGGARVFSTLVKMNEEDKTRTFHFDHFKPKHLDSQNKRATKSVIIEWTASKKKVSVPSGPGIFGRIQEQINKEENRQRKQARK